MFFHFFICLIDIVNMISNSVLLPIESQLKYSREYLEACILKEILIGQISIEK